MNAPLSTVIAELRAEMERLYGARLHRLVLFGSRARGDAGSDSDIDIMVVLEGPLDHGAEIERTGESIAALSLRYEAVISCVYATPQDASSGMPFFRNVRREGVAL